MKPFAGHIRGLLLAAALVFVVCCGGAAILSAETAASHFAPSFEAAKSYVAPVGQFSGKFELVPLFDHGHRPVVRNGHQFYAERNTFSFERPNGEVVTVFAGETTDLASIPSILWVVLPPDGPYAEAAGVHDACFKSVGSFDWRKHLGRTLAATYTQHGCDVILDEGMIALGVVEWKRVVIFEAVEWFGHTGWGH